MARTCTSLMTTGALMAFGGTASADPLVIQCGDFVRDLRVSSANIAGLERQISVGWVSEDDRTFSVGITPVSGLTEAFARQEAVLTTDIVCMYLDSKPVVIGSGSIVEGSWVFAAGCQGESVRLENKC